MAFKLSERSKERRRGVDPRLIEICDLALAISIIDFGIPAFGGVRSDEDQLGLFQAGKSMCDGVDSRSGHQDGIALDFYAYVDGKASWATEHLTAVAAAFLQAASQLGYKLIWGGHWRNFRDMPHVMLEV